MPNEAPEFLRRSTDRPERLEDAIEAVAASMAAIERELDRLEAKLMPLRVLPDAAGVESAPAPVATRAAPALAALARVRERAATVATRIGDITETLAL